MLFSSIEFLYYFLPIVLAAYFITVLLHMPLRVQNAILLVSSLIFYAWGEPKFVILMVIQAFSAWFFGYLADRFRGTKMSKISLIAALVVGIGGLIYYKYADFFIGNFNLLFGANAPLLKLALPLGISFYTFQALSYTIDVYRGNTAMQPNFFTFATYLTLFPQLIAGPIVRYTDVEREIMKRDHSIQAFAEGARRFVIGLGKKVLIANVFGELVSIYHASGNTSMLFAWLYVFAYSFHIYFDFSGYSDMAIGMGRMFGFKFLENFNYPFIAKSISDFWRRWHISMSTWFRDYVYIPLGGNRVNTGRFIFNTMLIWLVTGFWHGAGWNFITWGIYFGVLMLFEKFVFSKVLDRLPSLVQRIYLALIILVSWTFFDSNSLPETFGLISNMFSGAGGFYDATAVYYFQSYAVLFIIAIIGSTPFPKNLMVKISREDWGKRLMTVAEPIFVTVLLLVITAYLVDGSFNPFIYFRF